MNIQNDVIGLVLRENCKSKLMTDITYMPTLERLKAVGGLGFAPPPPPPPPENCFSEGRKMVHSVASWI